MSHRQVVFRRVVSSGSGNFRQGLVVFLFEFLFMHLLYPTKFDLKLWNELTVDCQAVDKSHTIIIGLYAHRGE